MNILCRIALIGCFVFLCVGCLNKKESDDIDLKALNNSGNQSQKHVIVLVIDSLMSESIDEGIAQKKLPTFEKLIQKGQYYKDVVSMFPTMSVTIDSSILTGAFPDEHSVPGLMWYSIDENRFINYGTGMLEIAETGTGNVLKDALVNLNHKHLNKNTQTIHEDLHSIGLSSGSVNGLIYRGSKAHHLTLPPWLYVPTSLHREIPVMGPDLLWFGSFKHTLTQQLDLPQGLNDRFGFNNQYSIGVLKHLIAANQLPDLLIVYLPDMDQQFHKTGPNGKDTLGFVKKVDTQLDEVLRSFGSIQKALEQNIFVLVGDSRQSKIYTPKEWSIIELDTIYDPNIILFPGEMKKETNNVALALNERMAYVYALKENQAIQETIAPLMSHTNIDLIAWKSDDWIMVQQGGTGKTLQYKQTGNAIDSYNQSWTVKGDLNVLDLSVTENQLTYGNYPDGLRLLQGALFSHKGNFAVITSKPGYEFAVKHSPTHVGGGGHGSLHKEDSLIPLIITGTNEKPDQLRVTELKPFLLKLLNKGEKRQP